jgi:acid stress-induced BolA-like protein IbaG/YrbA
LKSVISSASAAVVSSTPAQTQQTNWNNVDFYYIDGAGVQQGPFKLNQLAGRNITAQTQIWYDPLPKWTTAGEVAALKSVISSASAAVVSSTPAQPQQTNWDNVDFYFMDGSSVQQGPFKLHQLTGKNITAHTNIWYAPLPNWIAAGEIPALKEIIEVAKTASHTSTVTTEDWSKKQFFIADTNGTQQGPLTLRQLEDKNITEATSVWYDPLPDWTTAGEVPVLKKIIDTAKAKMEEWRNKFYFFTDAAGTRQGPFKLDQLKDKNITAQTPVWYDPLTEWTTAGEVPALKEIISN